MRRLTLSRHLTISRRPSARSHPGDQSSGRLQTRPAPMGFCGSPNCSARQRQHFRTASRSSRWIAANVPTLPMRRCAKDCASSVFVGRRTCERNWKASLRSSAPGSSRPIPRRPFGKPEASPDPSWPAPLPSIHSGQNVAIACASLTALTIPAPTEGSLLRQDTRQSGAKPDQQIAISGHLTLKTPGILAKNRHPIHSGAERQ